jgi:membrane-associated phospholipid phosphatase
MDKTFPAGSERRSLAIPLGLVALGGLALSIDLAVSRRCVAEDFRLAHRFLEQVEPFGQPPGAIIISLALWTCGALSRRDSLRVVLAPIASGLTADFLKLLVARSRPYHFFRITPEDTATTVFDTFQGWLPLFSGGSRLQSCPSAHTAFVTGFCVALSRLFPGGRLLFAVVATLVALQRIEGGAHFVSDTLWGGAVGYCIGTWWMTISSHSGSDGSVEEFDSQGMESPAQTV